MNKKIFRATSIATTVCFMATICMCSSLLGAPKETKKTRKANLEERIRVLEYKVDRLEQTFRRD